MDNGHSISDFFSDLTEPRDTNKRHKRIDIFTIAVCAVICGADTGEDIEEFGITKNSWFETFLELPHGILGHDTFARVFASLNPKEFQQAFLRWVEAIQEATKKRIVAIDGKTRSHTKGTSPLHLVSAWTLENRMVLGQVKTKEKSNEITAIPELLKVLELEGCIVTIDAMGCQKEIAATIITRDADYVLGLKGNRETLHEEVKFYFEECHSSRGIVMVERERYIDGITSLDTSYYITSIRNDPGTVARAIRGHWGIENSLHWVLDIAFREDECRIRKENAPANFATLRHRALNLLRRETSLRRGIKGKRLKAGWDTVYLERILIG